MAHVRRTLARDPEGVWVFVVDQLNIHQSVSLVDLVAEQCGLSEEVAQLRAQGGLKAMASRAAWLSKPEHRIQFVYTPKHTSWLNQIELWFSILVRRALRRGNFPCHSRPPRRQLVVQFRASPHLTHLDPSGCLIDRLGSALFQPCWPRLPKSRSRSCRKPRWFCWTIKT